MRYSLIIPATLLAAGVAAHPHRAGHVHHKRDEIHEYLEGGNVIIEEIVVHTKTLAPGEKMPAATTSHKSVKPVKSAHVEEKFVVPSGGPHHQYGEHYGGEDYGRPQNHHYQPSSTPSSSPPPVVVIPTSSPPEVPVPVQTPPPQTSSEAPTPADTSSGGGGSPSGTGPVPGPSNIDTKGSQAWSSSPNSEGKSIIGTANYWRAKWHPGLSGFEWDETLAANARLTAVNPDDGGTNEQGASVMHHHLYPGSMGQCINEGDGTSMNGDLTPFENAWLGWLCEVPTAGIPCDQIGETGHYGIDENTGKPETGHADIIGGSYTKLGCYYMDSTTPSPNFKGMWTCDFA